jgi:hypothetical protein
VRRRHPLGSVLRHPLLVERVAGVVDPRRDARALEHPAGPALQRRRPVPQGVEDAGPHRHEVLDDVDLPDPAVAEVRLLRAGDAYLVPVDVQDDGVLAAGHGGFLPDREVRQDR